MQTTHERRPSLGLGIGLRRDLIKPLIEQPADIDWLEILSDVYVDAQPAQLDELDRLRERYPLAMHGGGLSVGGPDALDREYLEGLKALACRVRPVMISDHLCWTPPGMAHRYDLRPLPHTREMIEHLALRIRAVQDALGRPILLENTPDPHPRDVDEMSEWEFIARVAEVSGCMLLLDLQNILLNNVPQGFEVSTYLSNLPAERIWEVHLAPLTHKSEYAWDRGDEPGHDPIRDLYLEVIDLCGPVPTILERNDDIPPLSELLVELEQIKTLAGNV